MDLEALAHPQRMKAVAVLGRRAAAGDADAAAQIATLTSHADAWWRWLGVLALGAGGRHDALVPLLTDSSHRVREAAWVRLAHGPAALFVTHLRTIADTRHAPGLALSALRRGSQPAVEALIAELATPERPKWLDLLAACPVDVVTARLGLLEEHGSAFAWQRLARNHPRLVAGHLCAALAPPPSSPSLVERAVAALPAVLAGPLRDALGAPVPPRVVDARVSWRVHAVLPTLAEADPDAALDLVEALFDVEGQAHSIRAVLRTLASLRPCRTFDLVRQRQARGLPAPLSGLFSLLLFPRPERLGLDRLRWAVQHAPAALPDGRDGRRWFARLGPSDRAALVAAWLTDGRGAWGAFLLGHAPHGPARDAAYARWRTAARDQEGVIAIGRLDHLPWDLREREARFLLHDLPWLQSRPTLRRVYARLLPWAEAEVELRPWIGHPDGAERATGWAVLLAALRHDRSAGPAALAAVRKRKNEQDPVRLQMITVLAAASRARIPDDQLGELAGVVEDALNAADLSPATARAAQLLVAQVLGRDPQRGMQLLARVLQVRGGLDGHALGGALTLDDARRLDPVLASAVTRGVALERGGAVVWMILGMQTRVRHMPQTLAALDGLIESPHLSILGSVLDLLRRYDHPRFLARAEQLFTADKSAVCLPSIAAWLATTRTDLLDAVLDGQPMVGRFATGRTHWVIDFGLRLGGWTPAQQAKYAAGLLALLDDELTDVPTCRWAIERLAALRFVPADHLLRFADDARQPVREIVLRALPYLDGGEGLPALLDCMGDDRARVATYALRRALRDLAPAHIFEVLKAVPLDRVTVAKEVLRLMGEYGGLAARDHLITLGARPLHRDVRIALLRALWDHIEHPPAWALLEAAAQDPDAVLVSRLMAIPTQRLSSAADARLCGLLGQVLARKEPEARLGFLAEVAAAPLRDGQRVLFQRLVDHLGTPDPDEAAAALTAVLVRMYPGEATTVALRVTSQLRNRPKARALLERLIGAVHRWSPAHHLALGRALVPELLAQAVTASHGVRLVARVEDIQPLIQALLDLGKRGLLHHDLIETACALTVTSPDTLCVSLSRASDARLRRVALAQLIKAAAPENGWTEGRRKQLAAFQDDPSIEVSAAAAWVVPPVG